MEANEVKDIINSLRDIQEVQASSYKQQKALAEMLQQHLAELKATAQQAQEQSGVLEGLKARLSALPDKDQLHAFAEKIQTSGKEAANLIYQVQAVAKQIPQQVQTEVTHRFEGRLKGMVIAAVIATLVTAISLSQWISAAKENSYLKEQDWKYRYLEQLTPGVTLTADTSYLKNPELFRKYVQQLELQREQQRQAQEDYRQKQQQADEAKEKLKELKK